MQPDDVFAPSYREYGAQFMRGVKPREVLLYWGGDERGNDFSGPRHDYSWCVPISTQCLHAAGAALTSSCASCRSWPWPAAATAARPRPTSTPRSIPPAPTRCRW
jgi:TPP-dependent pyruvate/acetoin dehydrogenase alpha subunit